MKRAVAYVLILIVVLFNPSLVFGDDTTSREKLNEAIKSQIDLINEIIKNPEAAVLKNWNKISNPHDESELISYLNSISNGTKIKKGSPIWKRVVEHSKSDSENSPLLLHMRLSIQAFNSKPGPYPPVIRISRIYKGKEDPNDVIAKGLLIVDDSSGRPIELPVVIFFKPNEDGELPYSLFKIAVNGKVVYGWW